MKPQERHVITARYFENKTQTVIAEELGISPILFNRDNEEYKGTIIYSFKELEKILE